jgi:peptidoglycan/LPS O-acetylase OafA/YrhL
MKTNYAIRGNHLLCLDGLRGVAIILVVLCHCFGMFPQFHVGWIGVDLFFVLSGFLITGILFETLQKNDYFTSFYRRRFLRILPLYFLIVGGLFFYINFIANTSQQEGFSFYTNNGMAYVLFMQNWAQMQGDVFERCHLAHLWSLAVEEQFYLIWPLVIFIAKDVKKIVSTGFVFVLIAIALRIFLYFQNPSQEHPNTFWNTFCRMDSLVIGALSYFAINNGFVTKFKIHLKVVAVLLASLFLIAQIGFGAVNVNHPFMVLGGFTLLAFLFAIVLVLLVTGNAKSIVHTFISNSFFRLTGRLSYGIYIFHWVLFVQLNGSIANVLSNYFSGTVAQIITSIFLVAITYLISFASFHYFEKVFLQFKNGFNIPQIQLPFFGAINIKRKVSLP